MARKKEKTFEEAMERLEEIVTTMEQGEIPLEESLKLFEEGTALVRRCTEVLDKAQLRVTQVVAGAEGEPKEMEFDHDA
ncbi:MAG: exodeoxyribonuclease VII small subunit [Ruminococcaceae bacterium]|nr:exodeoxyribonuclease VII small subunit [Oscillospiraceae bacterium]